MNLQARMNLAFEDYFAVSEALNSDVVMFYDIDDSDLTKEPDISWKRNFVRVLAAVIEGYSNMIRQIAEIEFNNNPYELSKKEKQAIICGVASNSRERIKYTLSGSYKIFNFPSPDFGTEDWVTAQEGLKRRDNLMHPKSLTDLEIVSESWTRIYKGLVWLLKQHYNFIQHVHEWDIKNSA